MTTRREFLTALAVFTGASGAFTAARALGLTEGEAPAGSASGLVTFDRPPTLPPGGGAKVVILGAGVAGLSAAYELGKAGFDCTVLEARERVGGRNFTVRSGTKLEMTDGTSQTCGFDDDPSLYFNAGPARLPSHHTATLGYCRELGVRMEPLVNHSESALIQAQGVNGGRPIQMRQAVFDTRGHLAELFSKSIRGGGLDQTMTKDDRDKLMGALAQWGALSRPGAKTSTVPLTGARMSAALSQAKKAGVDLPKSEVVGDAVYAANSASGWIVQPGAGTRVGVPRAPLPLSDLLHPIVGLGSSFHDFIDMQATMMQPVGGMDMIPRAFEAKLGPVVRKGCVVTRIARRGRGVEVSFSEHGAAKAIAADYCLITIPLSVLKDIPTEVPADRKAVIDRAVYQKSIKIAFQAPRFWETNDQIYGGLSFTDRDTFITWYPSGTLMAPQGVLVAGYAFGDQADRFARLPLEQRYAYGRETVERLHPGQSASLKAPITVSWQNVPYNLGIECPLAEQDPAGYALLSDSEGPVWFAGEHLSHVGAWQQGAFLSSWRAIGQIAERHRALHA